MAVTVYPVDGMAHVGLIHHMNALAPEVFPPLTSRHLSRGYWWVAQDTETFEAVAFAGLVPMEPFDGVGYLKRAYVLPQYRGQGLQRQFMQLREEKARALGWHLLVSECANNEYSERNFIAAGFERCSPEQPWGASGSVYFKKKI
jgi:GNAT superfamily N-acetyltransferase